MADIDLTDTIQALNAGTATAEQQALAARVIADLISQNKTLREQNEGLREAISKTVESILHPQGKAK